MERTINWPIDLILVPFADQIQCCTTKMSNNTENYLNKTNIMLHYRTINIIKCCWHHINRVGTSDMYSPYVILSQPQMKGKKSEKEIKMATLFYKLSPA
jgi:hypothetical protein